METILRYLSAIIFVLCLLGVAPIGAAELRLAAIFSDHMVWQCDQPQTVWGWADPGDTITVRFSPTDRQATGVADEQGRWEVRLDPLPASHSPGTLVVETTDPAQRLQVHDILVGEVWHASGQSNMEMSVRAMSARLDSVSHDMSRADLPEIRFCRIDHGESASPLADLNRPAVWRTCSPDSVGDFSGVAFYFARELSRTLQLPVGVIDSSRGGTPIEPYIPESAFQGHPTLVQELELGRLGDLEGIWRLAGGVRARDANWLPGRLFNSRIAPIASFPVRGLIWYQGESNCGDREDPRDYQHKMRALVEGWRDKLSNPDLPCYFVQLPGSGAREGWPYLREQQRLASQLPHTGMVVTIDLLDGDIHPPNKVDVGLRLARWALAETYLWPVACRGPELAKVDFAADGTTTAHFLHADGGLMVAVKEGLSPPAERPDVVLEHFELTDGQGTWHPATATLVDSTVVVRSDGVKRPVAVRYGYATAPEHCHLYNRDGLPASPFCSRPELLAAPRIH